MTFRTVAVRWLPRVTSVRGGAVRDDVVVALSPRAAGIVAVGVAITLAGCGTSSHSSAAPRPQPPAPSPSVSASTARPVVTPAPKLSTTAASTPAEKPTPTSTAPSTPTTPVIIRSSAFSLGTRTAPGGAQVTVATFPAGSVRVALHAGSTDPGGAAAGLHALSAITTAERPMLLAAFNGGFLLSSGAGGYVQEGRVIRSLVSGLATLSIDGGGLARVGVWGRDLSGSPFSARQNLRPLVVGGRPAADAGTPSHWGAVLGGHYIVARSAVATDSAGNLLYAGSMATTPADLASALIGAGAVTGMELDINPQWVQLALAQSPGGPLQTGVPGQHRPASQYLTGWSRDFFAVLAR